MAAESGTNWWPLVIGGFGALTAIFLKEAVQTALKRQILLGQLNAYLIYWNQQILRTPTAFAVFSLVQEREKKLTVAFSKGKAAFTAQHTQHTQERDELRAKIKAELTTALGVEDELSKPPFTGALLTAGMSSVSASRQYLMDNKTFISDSDAAHLGPLIANATVSFRSSAAQMLLALEGLMKTFNEADANASKKDLVTVYSQVVDSIILDGEAFFSSLIRLERYVQHARKRNLLKHTWDVLRGR